MQSTALSQRGQPRAPLEMAPHGDHTPLSCQVRSEDAYARTWGFDWFEVPDTASGGPLSEHVAGAADAFPSAHAALGERVRVEGAL